MGVLQSVHIWTDLWVDFEFHILRDVVLGDFNPALNFYLLIHSINLDSHSAHLFP